MGGVGGEGGLVGGGGWCGGVGLSEDAAAGAEENGGVYEGDRGTKGLSRCSLGGSQGITEPLTCCVA